MPRWRYHSIWCSDDRVLRCLPPWCELLSESDVKDGVPADLLAQLASSGQLRGDASGHTLRKLPVSPLQASEPRRRLSFGSADDM